MGISNVQNADIWRQIALAIRKKLREIAGQFLRKRGKVIDLFAGERRGGVECEQGVTRFSDIDVREVRASNKAEDNFVEECAVAMPDTRDVRGELSARFLAGRAALVTTLWITAARMSYTAKHVSE